MKRLVLISCLSACILAFNQCAKNPVTGKRQVVLMSEAQEIAMGQEADPQIVAQFGVYEDSSVQRFMRQKGMEMAVISHRPNLPWGFRVLDSEVINAFAVPGGHVYFTRGILAYLNNEAQFAGVLGHEIGHVTARHGVEQQRNQILGQIGLIAGIIINPNLVRFADAASAGLQLMFLKFSRDAERESDGLGVTYSTKIGYDAQEMAKFFTTLERQRAATTTEELPEFLSTHPDPGDRYNTVTRLAAEEKQRQNLTNPKVNHESYLRLIDGIIFGEDPRQGFLENNYFYHPVLRFYFPAPSGWSYQNTPQRVQFAPKDGRALMFLAFAPGNNLNEAASTVVQQYQLTVVESRNINVNGFNAIYILADQQPQQQGQPALRTMSYLIQQGTNIYHMIGVATITDFNMFSQYFNNTMQNFRELTDQSKINKKPQRVRVRSVGSSGTLAQAFRNLGVAEGKLEDIAVLNGMKLTDNITAGTLVKVIGE
jgi:predicted Zn-dependent protease